MEDAMNKLVRVCFALFFISLFMTNFTFAQQWTDEQKAVWAGVEAYWAVSMSDNPKDFLSYFDESYLGWNDEDEAPSIKADAQKELNYWTTKGKVAYYTIKPAGIWVKDNFAFAHYYYTQVVEGLDGKPATERGRWTDILMKKDGKWIMIGDHGGRITK
jgi:hypothetical protein